MASLMKRTEVKLLLSFSSSIPGDDASFEYSSDYNSTEAM